MLDINAYFRFIQSPQNDFIKRIKIHLEGGTKASKLRKESGEALIEGIHLVKAWIQTKKISQITAIITSTTDINHPEISLLIEELIQYCQDSDTDFPELIMVEDSIKDSISSFTTGPCLMAMVCIPKDTFSFAEKLDTIILDAIQDSGNVGTILRTAAAAGYKNIVCTVGTASIWSIKVLRAGMGAHLDLTIMESVSAQEYLDQVTQSVYVTALDTKAKSLYDLGDALLQTHTFVFGNEGQGASLIFLEHGITIIIPQEAGIESLNVSAAAAVSLFEARRIRRKLS